MLLDPAAAIEVAVARMVQTLEAAFEKEGIDMNAFKPNHFATLSVYFCLFFYSSSESQQKEYERKYDVSPQGKAREVLGHPAGQGQTRGTGDGRGCCA